MRGPSPRIPINSVSLYRYRPGQDSDAGAVPDHSSLIAANVDCTVQTMGGNAETVQRRTRDSTDYDILFFEDYQLQPKDLIVWVDETGRSHSIFVLSWQEQAGRSAAWKAVGKEIR